MTDFDRTATARDGQPGPTDAWFQAEHRAYGVPFPSASDRFDRLAEQLEVVTGLWSTPPGQRFSYRGASYDIERSPALPKPVQRPGPMVIVGGRGHRRTSPTVGCGRMAHP